MSAFFIGINSVQAQLEPTSAGLDDPDEIFELDPFTVTTTDEGYKAIDTLGGSRVRTDIADTPSALSVITATLMRDLAVTDAEDLLIYTTNTEVSGLYGNFSGVASRGFGVVGSAEDSRLGNPTATNRARGLTAMDNARNYFQSEIPWDGFNISRVDISRGPNSFLFGVGSPSGISNVSTNEAVYSNFGSLEAHYGSHGTTRESLDYNMEILPSELAVRVDLVNDRTRFKQKPAYNDSQRAYVAARFDPEFLKTSSSYTRIQFNYEYGEVDSNNPRLLPPLDRISGYFDGDPGGYNPFTFEPTASGYDPNTSPWVTNADIHYSWGFNSTYRYDGTTGQLMSAFQGNAGGRRADGNSVAGFNAVDNAYHLYTAGFARYAIAMNSENPDLYPGADARTVTYLDHTLTDSSVFDFYNRLIDGPNKHEWQEWDTYNLSIVQSLFNDRLVLQGVVTHEDYEIGLEGALVGYIAPYISVDLDSHMLTYPTWLDGSSTNPNVGRPFIAGDFGGGDRVSYYTHNNYQLTAAYSLDFEDLMEESILSRVLGHQEFTGLAGHYITDREDRNWLMYANDTVFGDASGHGQTLAERNINWVAYLGDSLAGRTSAKGAHLSHISTKIVPTSGPVTVFDGTWVADASVDPTALWVNPVPGDEPLELTEIENPANYAGYQPLGATVLNSKEDIRELYSEGAKSRQTLSSGALLYQGYFWDEAIIPSFGFRRDRVRQQGDQAPKNAETNIASMDYQLKDDGAVIYTTSISYGVSVHLAKLFKDLLPEGTDITLYYFHGSNQTPEVRYGIDGTALDNEEGETDDFSIQLDALDGRVTVRLGVFKTVDNYARASYGDPLGSQSYLIDSLPSWALGFGATAAAAATMAVEDLPSDVQGNSWLWNWATEHPDTAALVANALQTEFVELFPQTYWDQYGLPVNVAAIQNGDWLNVLSNGASPIPWNIVNSHLIHGTTPVIDQNLESKGFELEATIRPFRNWDLTFNASKVDAHQTSLGDGAANYLNEMARLFLDTDLGLTPMWGSYENPISNEFMSGLWAPYLTQVALTGTDQPELRKWNFKLITNYRFEEGTFTGLNIGGAFRWASKQILGYGIKEDEVWGNTAWISDVDQPIYGPDESHYDLWVGYQRALNSKIDWRIQVNLKNVGESAHLVPVAVQPDGTVAQQRIEMGQSFDLAMKFIF